MKNVIKPWYRQLTPWLLLLGPILAIVAGIYTLYLAASSDDGLVVDDYYKQGKAINQVLTRDRAAAAAGLQANIVLGQDRKTLRVILTHRPDFRPGNNLTLRLQHPTRSEADLVLPLAEQAPKVYQTLSPQTLGGRWYISVEQTGWRLSGEWDMNRIEALTLMPAKI